MNQDSTNPALPTLPTQATASPPLRSSPSTAQQKDLSSSLKMVIVKYLLDQMVSLKIFTMEGY